MGILSDLLAKRRQDNKKADEGKPASENEMSFLDHLEELRWHIIRSLIAIAIVAVVIFMYVKEFIEFFILQPFKPDFPVNRLMCHLNPDLCFEKMDVVFIAISPYEQFLMAFSVSIMGGFIVSFPYIAWETWRFIRPGLHENEQKKLSGNVAIISFLFFLGVVFSYYVVTPFSVTFLSEFKIADDVQNQWKIGEVIDLVTQIVLGGAIIFELPIVVYYLSRLGVLSPQFMREYHRHAIVLLLVIAAVITPPDVLSMILIFIPLIILYEISILVSVVVTRKQDKEFAEGK